MKNIEKINMKSNKNGLTTKEKEFILENYADMRTSEICEKLKIGHTKVNSYASSRKLKKNQDVRKDKGESFDDYINNRINLIGYNIYDFLNNKKEPRINKEKLFKSKYGKYFVNRNYFENIDNEWKAYWLGFLYADGCISLKDNTVRIRLQRGDKAHLQKFLDSLQSDSLIRDNISKLNGKEFKQSEVYVCNSKIVEDLINHNCVPNKSLILEFPSDNIVPKELKRHFIRGYFDGDGWIHCSKTGKKRMEIGFIGTPNTMLGIKNYLENTIILSDVVLKKNHGKTTTMSLCYGKFSDCDKIYNHLYKDCNIYLERKLNKFDEILYLK